MNSKKTVTKVVEVAIITAVFLFLFLFLCGYFSYPIAFSLACWVVSAGVMLADLLHYGEIARAFPFFVVVAALVGIALILLASLEAGLCILSFLVLLFVMLLILSR